MGKSKQSANDTSVIVVLGIDTDGKPHASRFPTIHADLAIRAAGLMKLHAIKVTATTLLTAALALPEGKIFATGRGLVPLVKRDLYEQFAPLIGTDAEQRSGEPDVPKLAPIDTTAWNSVGVGQTVLAHGGLDEGWYEAVVLSADDTAQTVTLAWRDYPREPKLTIHRSKLGLIQPA